MTARSYALRRFKPIPDEEGTEMQMQLRRQPTLSALQTDPR